MCTDYLTELHLCYVFCQSYSFSFHTSCEAVYVHVVISYLCNLHCHRYWGLVLPPTPVHFFFFLHHLYCLRSLGDGHAPYTSIISLWEPLSRRCAPHTYYLPYNLPFYVGALRGNTLTHFLCYLFFDVRVLWGTSVPHALIQLSPLDFHQDFPGLFQFVIRWPKNLLNNEVGQFLIGLHVINCLR